MAGEKQKRTREEIAMIEVGHTEVSPVLAWALTAMFLLLIVAVPIVDQALDALGDGQQARVPVVAEAVRIIPGPRRITRAIREEGPAKAVVVVNRNMLQAIHDYEKALEDRSFIANTLIPPTQRILVEQLRAGTETVYCGHDRWLFFRKNIDYLIGPGFLDPGVLAARARQGSETVAPPQPDPVKAIIEFRDYLSTLGITLVVMPAPIKACVYPERFSGRYDGRHSVQNSSYPVFKERMVSAGIELYDPAPVLIAAKDSQRPPLFLKTDTHWSPEGLGIVAHDLAAFLRARGLAPVDASVAYRRESEEVTNRGDISAMLRYKGGYAYTSPETVTIQRVQNPDGSPWRSDPRAEILLLGDSYANIYTHEGMGWGGNAGLPAQLAAALQCPVDTIIRNDAGAYATRAELARALGANPSRLQGKRVVIWEFAAREFSQGDWKLGLTPAESGAASLTSEHARWQPIAEEERAENLRQKTQLIAGLTESLGGWGPWYESLAPLHSAIEAGRAASPDVIEGRDEWLFHGLLAEFFTVPVEDNAYLAWKSAYQQRSPDAWVPGLESSIASIVDTSQQLRECGVELLFVPIPDKLEVYPEFLSPDVPEGVPASPQRYRVMQRLLENGVDTLDLLPAFEAEESQSELSLYPKYDPHWRDAAVRAAAREIAQAIRPRIVESVPGAFPGASAVRVVESTCAAALARQAGLTLSEVQNERDVLHTVTDPDGTPYDYAKYPDAPILVIGDSFMMRGNQGASLAAHLAHELGVPVYGHSQQNGAQNVPATLAREGSAFWSRRRIIVWYAASGVLGRFWKKVDFSESLVEGISAAPGAPAGTTEDSRAGQLQIRATLHAKSHVPTPDDIAPYTENLTVFAYHVEEVLYGECALPLVYVAHWGVKDSKAVPFTRDAEQGDKVELVLERFDMHPELEGVNLSDSVVENYRVPLLFDAGGLALGQRASVADTMPPLRIGGTAEEPVSHERPLQTFTASELAARKEDIEQDLVRLQEQETACGGWDACWQASEPWRTALQRYLPERNEPDLYFGKNGFVFSRSVEIPYTQFNEIGTASAPPALTGKGARSPLDVIVHMDRQLKTRGIHLICVPVPPRSELEAESLLPEGPEVPANWTHPGRAMFLQSLLHQDVEAVDVLPLIQNVKADGTPVSLVWESHWTPDASWAVAGEVARRIGRYDFAADPALRRAFAAKESFASRIGAYAKRYAKETGSKTPESERVHVRAITNLDGTAVPNPEDAPVIVLGDSYVTVNEQYHSDFRSHLAAHLGLDVAGTVSAGGGPRVPRDLAALPPEVLSKHKVVVWLFVARYLVPTEALQREWIVPALLSGA